MKIQLNTLLVCFFVLGFNAFAADWKIATYNIRNFKSGRSLSKTDLTNLKKIIINTEADFLGVQEIVDHEGFASFIEEELPKYGVVVEKCGGSGRQNLGFIYKKSVFELRKISLDMDISLVGSCTKGLRPALIGDFYWKPGKIKVRFIDLHLKAGADQDDKLTKI